MDTKKLSNAEVRKLIAQDRKERVKPKRTMETVIRASKHASKLPPADKVAVNKFGNQVCYADGYTFQSKLERDYYYELKIKLKAGLIRNLLLQQSFVIMDEVILYGKKQKARVYIADFTFFEDDKDGNSHFVVVDTKGKLTPEYILKRHAMKLRNNIEIREVYAGKTGAR